MADIINARILLRGDSEANWLAENPALAEREPSAIIGGANHGRIKIGDGVTPWSDLPFSGGDYSDGAGPYTFIIDSDAALAAWADNTPGNDYSRILIKAGTWTLDRSIASGTEESPNAFIDISDGRTLSVVGETGSRIILTNTELLASWVCGIRGRVTGLFPALNNPGSDFFFENVSVNFIYSGTGSSNSGFLNCSNLSNCTGSGSGSNSTGFRNCRTGFGNRNGPASIANGTFSNCFMEQNTGSTPWDNTASGGWNWAG